MDHADTRSDSEPAAGPETPRERALHAELDALRQRVEALERALQPVARFPAPVAAPIAAATGLPSGAPIAPPTAPPPALRPPPPPPPPAAPPAAPMAATGELAAHPKVLPNWIAAAPDEGGAGRSVVPDAPRAPFPAPGPAPARPARRPLELLVGGRLTAWVGALVVLAAVVVFFKFAYDEGWLGRMTPTMRCLLAAAFGGLLIAGGEIALRRVGRAAAVGLFAAGIGTIYVTAAAAYRHFHIVDDVGAFLLLAAAAAIGVLVAIRARTLVVGVLSIGAGYAAPLVVAAGRGPSTSLAVYLTMLLVVVLALSLLLPRPFRALRSIALPMHGLLGWLWLGVAGTSTITIVVFLVTWWSLVFAEGLIEARRGESKRGNALVLLAASAWVVLSLTVGISGAFFDVGWAGIVVAVMAVAAVAMVCTYDSELESLRRPPRTAWEYFAAATWLQGGVLLAAAAAIQFSPTVATIAWWVLALAAVEFGRRLRSAGACLFGLLVAGVATFKFVTVDRLFGTGGSGVVVAFDAVGLSVTVWSLTALVGAALVGATAWRLPLRSEDAAAEDPPPSPARAAIARAVPLLGTSVFCLGAGLALIGLEASGRGPVVPLLWLGLAVLLLAWRRAGAGLNCMAVGVALFAAAFGRWIGGDLFDASRSAAADAWWNAHLLLAIPMALVAWWIDRLLQPGAGAPAPEAAPPAVGSRFAVLAREVTPLLPIVTILLGVSVELFRAVDTAGGYHSVLTHRVVLWTALWSVGGLAMLRVAAWRRSATSEQLGVLTIGASLFCWLVGAALFDRMAGGVAEVRPIANSQALAGAVGIAAALAALPVVRRRARGAAENAGALALLALAAGLVLGSLEVERFVAPSSRLPFAAPAVSIWWGIYGAALIAAGFLTRRRLARYGGLAVLGATVVKFLIADLHGAPTIWRVGALLAVGLLLVGTSIAYVRHGERVVRE